MEYSKEPFNLKLFVMRMLEKWYQFVLCTLAGSMLFGGVYYLYKVMYAPAREFEAYASYYIEYVNDPDLIDAVTYYTEYTLNSWVTEDIFVEQVEPLLSRKLTREQLASYVTVSLPSDLRIMRLKALTPDPKLTMELLNAYDAAFQTFAEQHWEIESIRLQGISSEAEQIKADIRTQRAFVLGGVLGLVLGGLCLILQYLLDDSIYLPETLSVRHGIKALGTENSEELAVNVAYAVKDCKKVAVSGIGDGPELPRVIERLKAAVPEIEWLSVPAMVQCPEAGEVLRGCDGCILTVVSGADKSSAIDRALSYYRQQDIKVLGGILWNADEKLLKFYRK